MSDEEVNDELVQLKETKKNLMKKTIELRNKLREFEQLEGISNKWSEKDFLPTNSEYGHNLFTDCNDVVNDVTKKSIAVSSFMMGIKFDAVDKKWISEHKYLYTANVKTKALAFFLEVIVDNKNSAKNLEVLDIVCHFINVRKCYSLEITPWIDRFTEAKDTSNLFSAISDYTEHNITRTKVLRKLQEYDVTSAQEGTVDDGGIMIILHAQNDPDCVYFEIRWVLRFVESLWRIDNFFVIQPISAGDDFLEKNKKLLQSFCKYRIKKDKLQELWVQLCSNIQQDEISQSSTGLTES